MSPNTSIANVLLIGTGGVGSNVQKQLVARGYHVNTLNSKQLDLNYPATVFDLDLSNVDILINCAGHTQGSYQGFLKNSIENQLSQINVNYTSNLFLLKHYANSRINGKYVWCSSNVLDEPRPFHSIYASTKAGSKMAIDLIRQEAIHIDILEVKFGLVKTDFRHRNFCYTQPRDVVDKQYDDLNALDPVYVAEHMVNAIENNTKEIYIK